MHEERHQDRYAACSTKTPSSAPIPACQLKLAGERGYKVVADIKYRSNSPSLSAEVQQLKAANANVLMPSSYTTDGILLVKTMAELGYSRTRSSRRTLDFPKKRSMMRSATSSKA